MKRKTRSVEYYRCWAGDNGDSGTWDTAYIDVPADTPDDKLEQAVREAAAQVEWRDGEAPVIVGLYCSNDDDEGLDDEVDGDEDGTPTTEPVLRLFLRVLALNPDARLSDAHAALFASDAISGADKAPLFDELERLRGFNPADPFLAHLVPIKAECHDDSHHCEVDFDARRWFQQASDDDIFRLAGCGWGGDYPADEVARFMEDHDEAVAEMFRYIERSKDGFECHVEEEDALRWLAKNRPYVHVRLTEDVDGPLARLKVDVKARIRGVERIGAGGNDLVTIKSGTVGHLTERDDGMFSFTALGADVYDGKTVKHDDRTFCGHVSPEDIEQF